MYMAPFYTELRNSPAARLLFTITPSLEGVGGRGSARPRRGSSTSLSSGRALTVRRVVMHLDLAGDDVGPGRLRRSLGFRSQDALVPFVDGIIDAAFFQAERLDPRLPGPVLGVHERLVSRDVDMFEHRGQNLAREKIVLIGVDADAEFAGVRGSFQHALSRCARRRIDNVRAAIDLRLREFSALHRVVPGMKVCSRHI